jgi:hypothetical protein
MSTVPRLRLGYFSKLSPGLLAKAKKATDDRVKLPQSRMYNGHGQHMAIGPCDNVFCRMEAHTIQSTAWFCGAAERCNIALML